MATKKTTKSKATKKTVKRIKCGNCGKLNTPSHNFCISCGTRLNKSSNIPKKSVIEETSKLNEKLSHQTNSKEELSLLPKWLKLKYVGIIAIMVIAIFSIYLLSLKNSSTSSLAQSNSTASNATKPLCTSSNECQTGYYCSNYGACLKAFCGDGVCTTQEKSNNSCPIDCGCSNGEVLNRYANECQMPANVSNYTIQTYVSSYLKNYSIKGDITSINNTYYGNESVKEAVVDCQLNQTSYPCQVIFYFNQNGTVVNIIRTS